MSKCTKWSDDEIVILSSFYSLEGAEGCIQRGINRSKKSIVSKAKHLGIEKPKGREWGVEEIAIVKKYYAEGGAKLCIENGLDRPLSSIRSKAQDLGIRIKQKTDHWKEDEIRILLDYYPLGGIEGCIKKGLRKSKGAIKYKASDLGLRCLKGEWSNSDLDILTKFYVKCGAKGCIQKGITKSISQINYKAKLLGLDSSNLKKEVWSDDEINILLKYYSDFGAYYCIDKGINRSISAIRCKAGKLGLMYKDTKRKWSIDEDNILKEYYPIEGLNGVMSRLTNRSEASIRNRAVKLNSKVIFFKNHWTDDEIRIILEHYPFSGSEGCQNAGLDRPKEQIHAKAIRLGIKNEVRCNNWTDTEINILKTYFPIGGYDLCFEKGLNRIKSAIKSKLQELGLTYNAYSLSILNKWSYKEIQILKKYYKQGGYKLCQKNGLKRTDKAIKHMARRYGLTRNYPIICNVNLWSEEEKALLREYYPIGGVQLCLSKGVPRTKLAISGKSRDLWLKVRKDMMYDVYKNRAGAWSDSELAILIVNYPSKGSKITELNRSVYSIKSKARSLGLKYEGCNNSIKQED